MDTDMVGGSSGGGVGGGVDDSPSLSSWLRGEEAAEVVQEWLGSSRAESCDARCGGAAKRTSSKMGTGKPRPLAMSARTTSWAAKLKAR